jgi:hypothetical protein
MRQLLKAVDRLLNGPNAAQTANRIYRFVTRACTGVLISLLFLALIGGARLAGYVSGTGSFKVILNGQAVVSADHSTIET